MSCKLTLSLGGHIETVEQAVALVEAIVSEVLDDEEGGFISSIVLAQSAMRRAIEGNMTLDLIDATHEHGGNFDDIDPLIEKYPSLQKMAHMENESGANTIERTHTVDGELKYTSVDHYAFSGALISVRELKEALATDTPITSIQRLIDTAELQAGGDFPPLTASPAVQVWLKIFAEKAA